MEKHVKWMAIGIAIGILMGASAAYAIFATGMLGPHFPGSISNFTRQGNFPNFTGYPRHAPGGPGQAAGERQGGAQAGVG